MSELEIQSIYAQSSYKPMTTRPNEEAVEDLSNQDLSSMKRCLYWSVI
ncbi:hypothetical protein [Oceanobacillus picturae]|nr:hypothetical protein [Oceanobacillus picturae]